MPVEDKGKKSVKNIRIIPRLDIKGPNLVKGIHLEGLRVLGKPERFARHYYESGADELIYMDVVASLYGRNSLHDIVLRTARDIFIPITVGGGLRTIEDIKMVLRSGADKVAINTAAIRNPAIISEAASRFGSSTVVISIEAIRQPDGRFLAYTDNGREYTGLEVVGWAKRVEELGAGEIVLTSVDREGTGKGYDIELTRAVSAAVSIPVIVCGGAGSLDDIKEAIAEGEADAVGMASMLHYGYLQELPETKDAFHGEGNVEYLRSGCAMTRMNTSRIQDIKAYLARAGIGCRHTVVREALDVE